MERRRGRAGARARERRREEEEILRVEWKGGEREREWTVQAEACTRRLEMRACVDLFIFEIYSDLLRILNSYGNVRVRDVDMKYRTRLQRAALCLGLWKETIQRFVM